MPRTASQKATAIDAFAANQDMAIALASRLLERVRSTPSERTWGDVTQMRDTVDRLFETLGFETDEDKRAFAAQLGIEVTDRGDYRLPTKAVRS